MCLSTAASRPRRRAGVAVADADLVPAALRCARCRDVIGVYEPVIVWASGAIRETSRAAEPALGGPGADYYHSACHAAQARDDAAGRSASPPPAA